MVISVCKAPHPPEWSNTLPKDLSLKNFIDSKVRNKPRQQLTPHYMLHGAIFWGKTITYLNNQDPYASNSTAYVMPQEFSIDIDSIVDFYLAENLYAYHNKK